MGLRHGRECVLCCWAIMALMFVVGAMNLLWMAALMTVMLMEKTGPGGHRSARITGIACVAWAAYVVAHG
jgi:predicted metal-binding membrane protein